MMTENDYIAEYVKEKHPGLLGADFALWRMGRGLVEFGIALREAILNTPSEEIKKIMESEDKT